MPFKVVQTIEDGETCLSVVPSGWESKGILRWPKKHLVGKLSQVETSVPGDNWEIMNCVNKREYNTRLEAELEVDRMENKSDTEVEDFRALPAPAKKVRNVTKTSGAFVPPNFNAWIQSSIPTSESSPTIIENNGVVLETVASNQQVMYVEPECTISEGQVNDSSQVVYMTMDSETTNSTETGNLKAVLENQKLILENQERQFISTARLQTTMDYVMELLTNNDQPHKAFGLSQHNTENVISPVASLEELNELESSLGDEKRMQLFLTGMTFICGNNGKAHGMDCCYKLIDYFFTRQFLTQCSWTGASRLADNNVERCGGEPSTSNDTGGKVPLKFFKKVRKLFLNLILRADRDFSEVDCEKFFKTVLKNSKQRTVAKSQNSKHKNRPKNLKYKSSKQNDENQPNQNPTIEVDKEEDNE